MQETLQTLQNASIISFIICTLSISLAMFKIVIHKLINFKIIFLISLFVMIFSSVAGIAILNSYANYWLFALGLASFITIFVSSLIDYMHRSNSMKFWETLDDE